MKKLFYILSMAAAGLLPLSNAIAQAELQVIHNAADPGAASVDIYVNGINSIDDFAFRTATPFIALPSGVPLNIGIAPGNSTSVNDTLKNFIVTLVAGEKYVAIARGVLSPGNFAANPDGIATAFDLTIIGDAQTSSNQQGNVDLAVHHGASDAPAVDVLARNVGSLVNDAAFGDATAYFPVPAGDYLLDITLANDNEIIVATYEANLISLSGGAGVVFASGFLNPAANQNGAAFGLFAALPNGTVIALPQTSLARLQVIHNAADPAASSVDVYLNGTLAIPAFAFRTATPFIDVPGETPVNIGIAAAGSNSVDDTLVNFTVQFANGETYVAIANGVLAPGSFAINPDGLSTGFTLWLQDNIRESAAMAGDVDFIVVHGATDAPTVDVQLNGTGTILVDNAAYGAITPYLSVPPAAYTLDVTPGNDNSVIVATYLADLSSLANGAAVVFASGFLDPAQNQNGSAFGLWATLPNGTTFPLSVVTGINDAGNEMVTNMHPNPVSANSTVKLAFDDTQEKTIEIIDSNGRLIKSLTIASGFDAVELSISGMNPGMYFIKTITVNNSSFGKLIVQ